MNTSPTRLEPSPEISFRTCASAAGLDQIHRTEVNLVSWSRALPAAVEAPLVTWARESGATFSRVIAAAGCDLTDATLGLSEPARRWVNGDIALLVTRFAALTDTSQLRVSFGAIRGDQCRKFHMDFVRYRLVTTYLGPGTQWVPDHAVDRGTLEHPAECPCDANQEIVRDASAVRQASAGDVIVMKGASHERRWGAVHRSPPIEGTGAVRVVLAVSTVGGAY